jgi:DNA processing protein
VKNHPIEKLHKKAFPPLLREINDPPERLYYRGVIPEWEHHKILAVVGSRSFTSYGKAATKSLIGELRGHNVIIVSGLAIGIDAFAHEAALEAGLVTVAIPGSGLDDAVLYPALNKALAYRVLEAGGMLMSEFENDFRAAPWSFPQRNRLVAGMADATLVIEAKERSGALITARLAMEYNRDVLALPGQIFSESSRGTHRLIRDGVALVRSGDDICEVLGINPHHTTDNSQPIDLNDSEKKVYDFLSEPRSRDEITEELGLPVHNLNILLSSLELKGAIIEQFGMVYRK